MSERGREGEGGRGEREGGRGEREGREGGGERERERGGGGGTRYIIIIIQLTYTCTHKPYVESVSNAHSPHVDRAHVHTSISPTRECQNSIRPTCLRISARKTHRLYALTQHYHCKTKSQQTMPCGRNSLPSVYQTPMHEVQYCTCIL